MEPETWHRFHDDGGRLKIISLTTRRVVGSYCSSYIVGDI